MTQLQLGRAINVSESMVRMVERGRRLFRPEYLQPLDDALGAQGVIVAIAPDVEVNDHPAWFAEYVETESRARRLDTYNVHVLHGLLQTEGYARAVLSAHCPTLDDDEVEALVEARLERQVLLSRRPLAMLSFVIEEWVLRRPIGGRKILKEQLIRLTECSTMRNVSIQVMRTDCETHAGFDGPMTLLETAEGKRVAYVEGQAGPQWVTDGAKVSDLEQRYANIRTQARDERGSLRFIEELAGEL